MFWILASLAASLVFYYFLYKPQQYWTKNNVKQGMPIPLLGDNFWSFLRQESVSDMIIRLYSKFKDERYVGVYQTTVPSLLIRDPDLIKQITVKDFDHFVDHRTFVAESVDPLWTKNLFSLKGEVWREMRATLSPTFTASKMRLMFVLMEKSAQQYVDYYCGKNEKIIELDLKDSFTRFANDVIANCAFGVGVDSLKEPENEFYLNGKEVTDNSGVWKNLKFLVNLMSPKIASLFKLSIFPSEVGIFFQKLVHDTVKVREDKNIVRPDMINLLMEARKGRLQYEESTEEKDAGFATAQESELGKRKSTKFIEMSKTEMTAQVLSFFFAGFDTISTMMSFACYELAVHPEIQERLRQEILKTHKECNGKLTYDILTRMPYMDMVVSESMRKNPPGPFVDRACTRAYTIEPKNAHESPVHLKPGDLILLPIAGLHADPEFFPNPNKFDPERFSDENKNDIKAYTYIPFGSGPRNCIGSRFALMECKTLIYHILNKFELVVIDKTTIPLKYSASQLNPSIEGGCWVGFKRREN